MLIYLLNVESYDSKKQSYNKITINDIDRGLENINSAKNVAMKVITYPIPLTIVAVVGEWMRKTKRNVETNDIINRFKELTINACFSRCKIEPKCSVFAMDKDILMGQTADCFLLKNHEKQKYMEVQDDSAVVELFVYGVVSVKYNNNDTVHIR